MVDVDQTVIKGVLSWPTATEDAFVFEVKEIFSSPKLQMTCNFMCYFSQLIQLHVHEKVTFLHQYSRFVSEFIN